MRRTVVIVVAATTALALAAPAAAAQSAKVAALQVALRAQGMYRGDIDGVSGPLTRSALIRFQRKHDIRATGKLGYATRCELGVLGKPLLGQRELRRGRVGWDVASLEFRLRRYGLSARHIDGRFDKKTAAALRRFQRAHGLDPDGIAGSRTFRALARGRVVAPRTAVTRSFTTFHTVSPGEGFIVIARRYRVSPVALARANGLRLASVIAPGQRLRVPVRAQPKPRSKARVTRSLAAHTVRPGESFFSIAQRYHVSPWRLARVNRLSLLATIVPDQRLRLPAGAHLGSSGAPVGEAVIRAAIDRWAGTYGVDPKLARAVAWMESGFQQDVVSSAGAIGVMQLLPETWEWVDTILIGIVTPRTYDGNVRAGVRYLRWQLDQFDGDVKLALAGYYQGARAVRERGLFEDTKQYVSVILQLYGSV